MPFTTLVDTPTLLTHLEDPQWVVFDCRFKLAEPERGRRDYLEQHIPGAQYLDLNRDLSSPVTPGKTGRHPLPGTVAAGRLLGSRGVASDTQVVAYDDSRGSIAARLWWMLKWLGHDAVAVLDGGFEGWLAAGGQVQSGDERRAQVSFVARPRPLMIATTDELRRRSAGAAPLLDARAAERYRGEVEPIDPVAGHIPGAISAPFQENLDAGGRFHPPDALKQRLGSLLGDARASDAVVYCGSGVTAAHDILAFAAAGLGMPRLYVGSWSEWVTDADNPVAVGNEAVGD